MSNKGFFGEYGGSYVPPQLEAALAKLADAFEQYKDDPEFLKDLEYYHKQYIGRQSPLYFAERLTEQVGGAKIYLKREDLNHTGAHKINHAVGQMLLAKRMGAKRIIAETGAGQHGVATATVAALMGLECVVYQGAVDAKRQELNVFRMELLGAKVVRVKDGQQTLKEAVDAALMDYMENYEDTYYLLGSAVGPHPYPSIMKYFQQVVGHEAREQILEQENKLPDYAIACVGGGSNAIGLFAGFMDDANVKLVGVEPAGVDINVKGKHAATMTKGTPGIIQGFKCYTLQEEDGTPHPVHSIAAGLDYPGVGPEHCYLKDTGRATYETATDAETLEAFITLSKLEGIIPALESSHAVAYAMKLAKTLDQDQIIIVNLSGRGDKDVASVKRILEKNGDTLSYIEEIQ